MNLLCSTYLVLIMFVLVIQGSMEKPTLVTVGREGNTCILQCSSTISNDGNYPEVRWYMGKKNLESEDGTAVKTAFEGEHLLSNLTLTNMEAGNEGKLVRCEVWKTQPPYTMKERSMRISCSTDSHATLQDCDVEVAINPGGSIYVKDGESVQLTCSVEGQEDHNTEYVWYIVKSKDDHNQVEYGHDYTVNVKAKKVAVMYRCMARRPGICESYKEVTVIPTYPPIVTIKKVSKLPSNVPTPNIAKSLCFLCTADASPPALADSFIWKKNGEKIPHGHITFALNQKEGSYLCMTNVKNATNTVECVVENRLVPSTGETSHGVGKARFGIPAERIKPDKKLMIVCITFIILGCLTILFASIRFCGVHTPVQLKNSRFKTPFSVTDILAVTLTILLVASYSIIVQLFIREKETPGLTRMETILVATSASAIVLAAVMTAVSVFHAIRGGWSSQTTDGESKWSSFGEDNIARVPYHNNVGSASHNWFMSPKVDGMADTDTASKDNDSTEDGSVNPPYFVAGGIASEALY